MGGEMVAADRFKRAYLDFLLAILIDCVRLRHISDEIIFPFISQRTNLTAANFVKHQLFQVLISKNGKLNQETRRYRVYKYNHKESPPPPRLIEQIQAKLLHLLF